MKVFELTPIHRKSFYGKCKVLEANTGIYELYSYDTKVATYNEETKKWWNTQRPAHLSQTTLRHIKAFQSFLGLELQNKAQLLSNEF
jgi:ABC-type transport system substrate-binding protein